jgi:DNA-binding transcriptional LysR family regulator
VELRHLRCFIAVAEELHFARAAARLHIEQSPLSRIIKELEYRLGVQLFERTTRRTRLTWAGKVLLEEARRVLTVVDQAKASVKSAAAGYRGRIRVALSDGIPQARLAALLAQCREEEPEVEICLSEVTFSEQVRTGQGPERRPVRHRARTVRRGWRWAGGRANLVRCTGCGGACPPPAAELPVCAA